MDNCIVCGSASSLGAKELDFNCPRCGPFQVTDVAAAFFKKAALQPRLVANLSGFLRENPHFTISQQNFDRVTNLATPSVSEKAEKIMFFLGREFPSPGESFQIRKKEFPDPLDGFYRDINGNRNAKWHAHILALSSSPN